MKRQHHGSASVAILFATSGPPTIAGFIPSIVIDPVYGRAIGSDAHVIEEVREAQPPIANSDSSPAIFEVHLRRWLGGSLDDAAPRTIGGCTTHLMRTIDGSDCLTRKAATRSRYLLDPPGMTHEGSLAAVALTAVGIALDTEDSETTMTITDGDNATLHGTCSCSEGRARRREVLVAPFDAVIIADFNADPIAEDGTQLVSNGLRAK